MSEKLILYSAPLQMLVDEHDFLLKAARRGRQILEHAELNADSLELKWLCSFFRNYGDLFHHQKEEELLFLKLEFKGHMEGILSELSEQHEIFRESLQSLEQALHHQDWPKVSEYLTQYLDMLETHIEIENDVLFTLADSVLTENEKQQLYLDFEEQDIEFGLTLKEAFQQKIQDYD